MPRLEFGSGMTHVLVLLAAAATFGSCPKDAVALTQADLPAARRVVLQYARRVPDMEPHGAYVTEASLARGWEKHGFISRTCGRAYLQRTAVVGVRYPAEARKDPTAPGRCNSCAGVEFLASRTKAGRWFVWYAL